MPLTPLAHTAHTHTRPAPTRTHSGVEMQKANWHLPLVFDIQDVLINNLQNSKPYLSINLKDLCQNGQTMTSDVGAYLEVYLALLLLRAQT